MRPEDIAVVESNTDLLWLSEVLAQAATHGRNVRLCVDGGLKVAVGGGVWTLPLGRSADQCGH